MLDYRGSLRSPAKRIYLLVGNSYGGRVAQAFATRFPQRVYGLLLLDPAESEQDLAPARVVQAYQADLRETETADTACLAYAQARARATRK